MFSVLFYCNSNNNDGTLENEDAGHDDKTDMYLDSDVKGSDIIALDGTIPSAGNDVDNIDINNEEFKNPMEENNDADREYDIKSN